MEFLCLLVGLLIPVVALGLVVRRAVRPLASASAYRNVAWKLGLEADTRGTSLQGWLDGRRLFVGEAADAPRGRVPEVRAVLDLRRPLGLGLRARRRPERRLARLGRTPGVTLGDPVLDRLIELRAFEPDRARALFTPDVRRALVTLLADAVALDLADSWICVRLGRPPSSATVLARHIDALREAADALERARAALPTPTELVGVLPAWSALADAQGLDLLPAFPALEGEVGGREVRVDAARAEQGFVADVRVAFLAHPPVGLSLVSGVQPAAAGQHIDTDDEAFDAAFVLKGYDPGALRGRFTAPVRTGLLALRTHGRVVAHDRALEVRGVSTDAATLGEVVDRALRVVDDLGW